MKRILSTLVVISILLSLFSFGGIAASQYNVTATVGSIMGATAGTQIKLPVTMSQYNKAYAAIHISGTTYDSSVLEFVGYEDGGDFAGSLRMGGPTGYIMIVSPTSSSAAANVDGGVLVYLVFNVLKTVKSAPTSVGVKFNRVNVYTSGSSDNWYASEAATVNVVTGGVKVDSVKPTGSISATNNLSGSQTVTLGLKDDYALAGYYWGTSSNYGSNTYTATTSTSVQKTVSSAGTYYLFVKDTFDNISTAYSITFYKTTLNAQGGSVSITSILTQSGKTVSLPSATRGDYIYKGWSTSASATSGVTSITVNGNNTYYAIWNDDVVRAKDVISKINAIGVVDYTDTCKSKIDTARNAYNALSTTQRDLVSNYSTLTSSETTYNSLVSQVGSFNTAVNAIGTVTLSDESAISACESTYNTFTSGQKTKASSAYSTLTSARTTLNNLKTGVSNCKTAIDKIGTVTYTSTCKANIDDARAKYNALNTDQKNNGVGSTYLKKLTDAESAYQALADEVTAYNNAVNAIFSDGKVTTDDSSRISTADTKYAALGDSGQQSAVSSNRTKHLQAIDAYNVAVKIDAIGTVDYTSAKKSLIDTARSAYNALDDTEKGYITAYKDILVTAENRYSTLKSYVDTFNKKVTDLGTITYDDKANINAALQYYSDNVTTAGQKEYAKSKKATLDSAKVLIDAWDTLVSNAVSKISAIGIVTYTSSCKDKIDAARNAYNKVTAVGNTALTNTVTNASTLTSAESVYASLNTEVTTYQSAVDAIFNSSGKVDGNSATKLSTADSKYTALTDEGQISAVASYRTKHVNAQSAYNVYVDISNIGTVVFTSECKNKIDTARNSYNAINSTAQGYVSNYNVLTSAESRYAALKAANTEAQEVVALIDLIGTVTLDRESIIISARNSYDFLSDDAKSFVSNYSTLLEAEARLDALKTAKAQAERVDELISNIGTVTINSETAIQTARDAYDKLSDDALTFVTKYAILQAAETRLAALKTAKAQAENVDSLINAIGLVTLDSEETIQTARDAYDKLSDDALTFVTKYTTLQDAEARLAALKAANTEAQEVVALIDLIGTVTLDRESIIISARNSYDFLSDDAKSFVSNYTTLLEAEARLDALKTAKAQAERVDELISNIGIVTIDSEEKVIEAREAYDALNDDALTFVTKYMTLQIAELRLSVLKSAKAEAESVDALIDAIGLVTLDSEETIQTARDAYDALSNDALIFVTKYTTLQDAEARLAALKAAKTEAQEVMALIDLIGTVTLDRESIIISARNSYDFLSDDAKSFVTNYTTLLEAEARLDALKTAKADAENVDALIDAIGVVSLESEEKIVEAREAYDALSDDALTFVTKYMTLQIAELRLSALKSAKAEAESVDALIDAIGLVTLDSEETIQTARDAYDNLSDVSLNFVTKYTTLQDAEARLAALKAAKTEAQEVIALIDLIGTVTLDRESIIISARNSYDFLSDDAKSFVSNYTTLLEAEARLDAIKTAKADAERVDELISNIGIVTIDSEEKVIEAREAYDALNDDALTFVTKYMTLQIAELRLSTLKTAKAEAENVDALIDAIGTVTIYSGDAIAAARNAYDELDSFALNYVTKYDVLLAAEQAFEKFKPDADKVKAVDDMIIAIGDVTLDSEDAIKAAREAYNNLTDTQKGYVTQYEVLLEKENYLHLLKNMGDVDCDGTVSYYDVLSVLQHSVGKIEIAEDRAEYCDVDGVEGIDMNDALCVLLKAVGKIDVFPALK